MALTVQAIDVSGQWKRPCDECDQRATTKFIITQNGKDRVEWKCDDHA